MRNTLYRVNPSTPLFSAQILQMEHSSERLFPSAVSTPVCVHLALPSRSRGISMRPTIQAGRPEPRITQRRALRRPIYAAVHGSVHVATVAAACCTWCVVRSVLMGLSVPVRDDAGGASRVPSSLDPPLLGCSACGSLPFALRRVRAARAARHLLSSPRFDDGERVLLSALIHSFIHSFLDTTWTRAIAHPVGYCVLGVVMACSVPRV